jgi:hypothetical protein
MNRVRVVFLIVIVVGTLAWWLGAPSAVEHQVTQLANQPSVGTVFRDLESGRTDALIALMAFALGTPIAGALIVVCVVVLVKMLEAVFVSLRVPSRCAAPVVGTAVISALYATSHAWIPTVLYGCRVAARAYVVYAYGTLPVIR